MIKNKLTFLSAIVILITSLSCSSDDDYEETAIEPIDNFYIESYHGFYAQYNTHLSTFFNYNNIISFEYDDSNRISKRNGDILYLGSGSGGGGYLHDSLYTDLVYANNKIHLEKKAIPFNGLTVRENETIIELDAHNRMIKKIRFQENDYPERDTTNYTYSNGKLMSFIKTSNRVSTSGDWSVRYFEESTLYYTNKNLDSIVTIYSGKESSVPYTILSKKETKHFSGYDSAQNPFRKLQIFEETFNRSLSENNFTEYRETSNDYDYPNDNYYLTPTLGPTQEEAFQTWSFAYDENGEWIYDQF
ncbi:hypothetical protein [Xanthomarina spongicola]|uniref:YD repeat-containing protein n=1 Tax=Xanthomarina spongicola TaxID=570520 RepID=A0A316DNI4_9FLAO|nr:hypothetical protein [Xanthomarina spongicola]PWK18729.1 hypothetical protein LX78_02036 [Xanthomarina spongicola]